MGMANIVEGLYFVKMFPKKMYDCSFPQEQICALNKKFNLAKQLKTNKKQIRNGRSRKMATYKERYLAGEIEFEEIDEYSNQWGKSDDERTLAQYLGLNAEEEDTWVSISEEALKGLLDKQRKK